MGDFEIHSDENDLIPDFEGVSPVVPRSEIDDTRIVAAVDYDEMVDWKLRLGREGGFYKKVFLSASATRVADIGCGSGRHAIMFAQWGLDVVAIDPSESMLAQAVANSEAEADSIVSAGGRLEFVQAGFGQLAAVVGNDRVDVIVCAGNTLPHVDGVDGLKEAFADFAEAMRPSGILVLHFLNHTRLLQRRPKFMPPVLRDTPAGRKMFLKVLEYPEDRDVIDFDFITLAKDAEGSWSVSNRLSEHSALPVDVVTSELATAGFDVYETSGGHDGRRLEMLEDESVVILARRRRHIR